MEDLAWAQFALVFWCAVCLFATGARLKSIPLTGRVWLEIGQAAVIVVLLFGLLTQGLGCRAGGSTADDSAVPCPAGARC